METLTSNSALDLRPLAVASPPHRRRIRLPARLRARSESGSGCDCKEGGGVVVSARRSALRVAAAAAMAVAVGSSSLCVDPPPAVAESLTVAFPVSKAREVNRVQRTLVEAWGLIRETFVDPTFNHQDWDLKLQETMVEMFRLKSADAAYNKLSGMLATLGDPFTRIISPKEFQNFRIGSGGNLEGVGLSINVEPDTGDLVVMSCVEGSPASRAGIHEGDKLIEINGEKVYGQGVEEVARKLRGQAGTSVTVKFQKFQNDVKRVACNLKRLCYHVRLSNFPQFPEQSYPMYQSMAMN